MEQITLAQALKRYFGLLYREDWLSMDEDERESWRNMLGYVLDVEIVMSDRMPNKKGDL